MHCPLFSRAWGPKVGIKIYERILYEYILAIAKSIYDTEVVKEYSIQ